MFSSLATERSPVAYRRETDEFGREKPRRVAVPLPHVAALVERPPSPRAPKRKIEGHPSLRYTEEPMLCEFLWNEEKKLLGSTPETDETYSEYMQKYCLNYIRSFFNIHLDDTWFRNLYSPYHVHCTIRQTFYERSSIAVEGRLLREWITRLAPETPHDVDALLQDTLRLSTAATGTTTPLRTPSMHLFSFQDAAGGGPPAQGAAWYLPEVPPQISVTQILQALHASSPSTTTIDGMHLWPSLSTNRDAYVLTGYPSGVECPHPLVILGGPDGEQILAELPVLRLPVHNGGTSASSLRKHKAPLTNTKTNPNKNTTVTLSVALSRRSRFERDCATAERLAAALDAAANIPDGYRLQDLLLESSPLLWQQVSDRLDFSIAYLRRVHLLSFYHAGQKTESLADVVTGQSTVSTIYLRQSSVPEDDDDLDAPEEGAKDLLVQRMDDGLAAALADYTDTQSTWHTHRRQVAQDAAAIAAAMAVTEQRWLSDHAVLDPADGRARCGFVECHKLFRDATFLYKHLLKKHSDPLLVEQAKCHDAAMMAAWDAAADRPVPDVLVDCGAHFGRVAAAVTGIIPRCVDPEPELVRRAQRRTPPPPRPRPMPVTTTAFVDVDDMKEEKVALSFENVPDAAEMVLGKKKKKRKLL